MADISDVEAALQTAVQAERATSFPTAAVIRGWPGSAELAAAAKAGTALVTVWQRVGFNRNTTRYPVVEIENPRTAPSLTVTVSGTTATFAGTCSTDQIAGVQAGTLAWVVRCGATDTPSTIAAALAALSGGSASGPALALPGLVAARTDRDGSAVLPLRQQQVGFAVIVWSPDSIQRDSIASAIDAALAGTEFLLLADGTSGRLTWTGSAQSDRAQNSDLYRRDLNFAVDYSTTQTLTRTPALFPGATINAPTGPVLGAIHP